MKNYPSAPDVFTKLVQDAGLQLSLTDMRARSLKDGAILVESPSLNISYTEEKLKELESKPEVTEGEVV